jgi:hypothetical protein
MPQHFNDLIQEKISDVLAAAGSNEVQRVDGMAMLPRYLEMRGTGEVVDRETGEPFGFEWIKTNKAFLLPPQHNPSEADAAFLSTNVTKRAAFAREVGIDEANRVARTNYGLKDIYDKRVGTLPGERKDDDAPRKPDARKNPWADDSPAGEVRRISAIKALGTKVCGQLAAACNVDIAGRPLNRRR